jgi:hypothetical protein
MQYSPLIQPSVATVDKLIAGSHGDLRYTSSCVRTGLSSVINLTVSKC